MGEVARYNNEDLIQQSSGLNTDGLGGVRLPNDHKKMTGDRVPGYVWRTVDKAMDVEQCDAAQLGDSKVPRLLLVTQKYDVIKTKTVQAKTHTRFLGI